MSRPKSVAPAPSTVEVAVVNTWRSAACILETQAMLEPDANARAAMFRVAVTFRDLAARKH